MPQELPFLQPRLLLDKGANPRVEDLTKTQPLHLAVKNGHAGAAELLLKGRPWGRVSLGRDGRFTVTECWKHMEKYGNRWKNMAWCSHISQTLDQSWYPKDLLHPFFSWEKNTLTTLDLARQVKRIPTALMSRDTWPSTTRSQRIALTWSQSSWSMVLWCHGSVMKNVDATEVRCVHRIS